MSTNNHSVVHHFICVWPDGVFCDPEDIMGMTHRSDDCANVPVGEDESDEDVADAYITRTIIKLS